jgi:hypothetical protein
MIRSALLLAGACSLLLCPLQPVLAQGAPQAPGTAGFATLDDPRVGLASGLANTAEQAAWHMRLVSQAGRPAVFDFMQGLTYVNSDLAFRGDFAYQGNFSGFAIWDISNPLSPQVLSSVLCATDQGDPTIYGHLLFISAESNRARKDCGTQGVEDGADRMRGIRIFDVSDPRAPRLVKNVETCRGSHTNTLVPHPTDPNVVYIYVGGSSGVRDASELEGCSSGSVEENPNTAQFRVDIIRVPVDNPEEARVVSYSRMFDGLGPVGRRGGPSGCHDLTAYPAMNLIAGACGSHGILLDISDPENPVRLSTASDENFSAWHTAVFNNDATSLVFTDEWGGGTQPRCREGDPFEYGGNTVLRVGEDRQMTRGAYFKMPAVQTDQENCVSHNGGLIPIPGRDIKVQGWYQGGVNVFDFTDPDNPFEIAFFDRGPLSDTELIVGGSWGAFWYNGFIYSSELTLGLDVLELLPSEFLSANEIEAAKLVQMDIYNPQSQPLLTWPPAFAVVRSYLDQLVRNQGLPQARTAAIDAALTEAEGVNGTLRGDLLTRLAAELEGEAARSGDPDRVRAMAGAVRALAGPQG